MGVATFGKGRVDNSNKSRALFEKAVELDPTNIDALVGAVRVDVLLSAVYAGDDRRERLKAAKSLLLKGLSIQPANYWAHMWLGYVQILTNRAARGIGELERSAGAEPQPRRGACVDRFCQDHPRQGRRDESPYR